MPKINNLKVRNTTKKNIARRSRTAEQNDLLVKLGITQDDIGFKNLEDIESRFEINEEKQSYGDLLELLLGKLSYVDSLIDILESMNVYKEKLESILKEHGHDTEFNTFEELLDAISNMYILNLGKTNMFVINDEYGFVEGLIPFETEMVVKSIEDIPEDILDGYFKLENRELVLDVSRKEELFTLD